MRFEPVLSKYKSHHLIQVAFNAEQGEVNDNISKRQGLFRWRSPKATILQKAAQGPKVVSFKKYIS